jgi:phage shock protein A
MANNRIKTRPAADNPSKNKVATAIGINKIEHVYKDLFSEFYVEHNGVEHRFNKLIEQMLDKDDKYYELINLLVQEVNSLEAKLGVFKEMVQVLDKRLHKLETEGDL